MSKHEGCKSYSIETSYGTEYDCKYPNSGGFSCEECIYGPYPETAKWNPETGEIKGHESTRDDHCPMCGSPVTVSTSKDGTSCYSPMLKDSKLYEALKLVEWIKIDELLPEDPNNLFCPSCEGIKNVGHFDDCKLAEALKKHIYVQE